MTTDGSEYLVRCFAYNMAGQRCEQLAGHDGNHAIVSEWTDEECFVPGTASVFPPLPPTPMYNPRNDPAAIEHAPGGGEECLICDHSMHRGMCKVEECDCRQGIPK